jgi:DNA-binding IscR family transcriptional regulator
MYFVGYNFFNERSPWTVSSLTTEIGLPREPVEETIRELMQKNLLVETRDNPPVLMPARSLEKITVGDIVEAVRTNDETDLIERKYLSLPAVDEVTSNMENARKEALGGITLKDLITKDKK